MELLLGFLAEPGILEIEIDGEIHRRKAPAGMTSFQVPVAEGRPAFRLRRKGQDVIVVRSAFTISNEISYQNLLIHAGSSTRHAVQPPSP